jgi:pyruvate/2-oxoglutarate/acetoin dehydrogenase E1 component
MSTVLSSLNNALHAAFAADDRVYLLGEDLLDPYGGAFKVSRGLSTAYPDRVLAAPISEAGITGIATGMALRGLRPVVEIMFGDFVTLIADQVINHAAKFRWMYNDHVRVPIVIRTPMGGRRGYGPTHSQTLEKHYLGVPGLRVLAPSAYGDPGRLLKDTILLDDDPVLFVENKLLYTNPIHTNENQADLEISLKYPVLSSGGGSMLPPGYAPVHLIRVRDAPPADLTITTYGYMAEVAHRAALKLAYEHEIFIEIVVPTQLSPFDPTTVLESIMKTRALLVIEEAPLSSGWGAEVIARIIQESQPDQLKISRLGAYDLPVPASRPLEERVLPGEELVIKKVQEMV